MANVTGNEINTGRATAVAAVAALALMPRHAAAFDMTTVTDLLTAAGIAMAAVAAAALLMLITLRVYVWIRYGL